MLESMRPPIETSGDGHASSGDALGRGVLEGVAATVNFDGEATIAFDETGAPFSYSKAAGTVSPLSSGSIILNRGQESVTVTVEPVSGEINVLPPNAR